ncbi:MAG: hypothetical protein L0191_09135, partial [Acidobacteria bacterium]|nr:hypothetical protein [Acidobacteriota bacterium]
RKAAVDAFLRQPGIQIVLRFPDSPVELRAFDPMNIQPVDRSRAIHRRMLRLSFGESYFSASDTPVLVDLGEGPFDIRGATFFTPKEDLEIETDFNPFALEPGTREFRSSLQLSSEGASLQAVSGAVSVSADGTRVEITLKR